MLYIVGDSNTMYLYGDPVICEDKGRYEAQHNSGYRIINGNRIELMWDSGKTAYAVSEEFLRYTLRKHNPKHTDTILFQYGATDIHKYLTTHNNTKVVVESYVRECIGFLVQYGIKPRFLQPFSGIEFLPYNLEFEQYLREMCVKYDLEPPIELFDKVIERDYPSEPLDDRWHLTYSDNAMLLEYIVYCLE
jgi:hypothetical protein